MNQPTTPLKHFKLDVDQQHIVWLGFDMAGTAVNRLSDAAMQELALALHHADSLQTRALIIYSLKQDGFIAGADLDELAGLDNGEQGLALVARGWKLFERLANTRYPTLALIHGHCLGGGLELALACRYRLAVLQDNTRLSLPEVRLGIFPGWGGMQRLPHLIGPLAALDLMLSGKATDARQAAALGLVDAAVAPRLAKQAAAVHVLSGRPARRCTGLKSLLNATWTRPLVARQVQKKIDQRDPHHHYAAPRAILDIWQRHDGNPLKAPNQIEALLQSPVSRNLLRVHTLQERLKQGDAVCDAASASETYHTARMHIVGAGLMGGDIAAWCALKGVRVSMQDTRPDALAQAQARAAALFRRRLKRPYAVQAALDRLIPDPQGAGVRHADIVLEAISEDADAKRALYQHLEPQLKDGAFLATNTSSLLLSELSQGLQHPNRLVGLHFFNPVAAMPLVELVKSPGLEPDVSMRAWAFVRQIGKLPLPVRDVPGFLVNAALAPYLLEAMRCVDEGIKPSTLDEAMRAFGMPVGPIELADVIGLDTVRAAGAQLSRQPLPECLEHRLERKELGKKSGQGFYAWIKGKPQKPPSGPVFPGLTERLVQPLIDTAHTQLESGIVADADLLDAGMVFGMGFAPFRGGPLHYDAQRQAHAHPANGAPPTP